MSFSKNKITAVALHIIAISFIDGFVVPQIPSVVVSVGHASFGQRLVTERRKSDGALRMSSVGAAEAASTAASTPLADDATAVPTVSTATASPPSSSSRSPSPSFTPVQHAIRALPFVATAAYLYDPTPLDDLVANIWSAVYGWDFAHAPLFEAEVAVAGFYIWIILYSSIHLILGKEKTKQTRFDGDRPNSHRPFEWLQPENYQLWFNPTAAYLGSIWLYSQIHHKPPLPEVAPTFGVLVVETLFGLWLYDLCFMPIHYLMHNLKLRSLRKVHTYHHRSKDTLNALEVVQHSYVDGFLQVAVNILVQQLSPFGGAKHVLSRLLHNLSVTYLLTEAHSGYRDLPWMSHNVFPELLGGAPRHEAHHHNGRVYYQQYFKYLDDFFGFTEDQQRAVKRSEIQQPEKLIDVSNSTQLANATAFVGEEVILIHQFKQKGHNYFEL